MTTQVACDWQFDVDRGPDWLLLRAHAPPNGDAEGMPLAEMIWDLMQQHFTRRVALDLSELKILRSVVIGQLVLLHKRIYSHEGLMRIVGLSDDNHRALIACRLHERFPQYATATEAIMAYRPLQPR
jgi:anti-anti-sigma regulatory factor